MKKYIIPLLSVLAVSLVSLFIYLNKENTTPMTYLTFLDSVEDNLVEEVIFTEGSHDFKAILANSDDTSYIVPNPGTEDFTEFLLTHNINVSYDKGGANQYVSLTVVLAIIGVIVYYSRKNNTSSFLVDTNKKKSKKQKKITLDQVAGNAEAKAMVEDVIGFIKNPSDYTAVGARMPKGLLFYGPPGTGKTLMAKAIAGEANVPFYTMSGSDFVQMYVGVGASRIRNLFKKAKKSEKAVIFIDEIDAIGKQRSKNSNASNDERDQTLNALLSEMSGFHDNQGIIVIGATNRLDTLDEALLRPGRFDRQIEIGLPDVNSRKRILALHSKNKPLAEDVDLDEVAKSTVYFSGAMLENLLNESAIQAANDKMSYITKDHIDRAFYSVIAGAPKTDRSYITSRDRKITAYHEAGHALVTKLLLPENFISKVTIIPSVRGAGGFNLSIPKDTLFQTQKQLLSNIKVLLAGRASEELIFGLEEISTGASNDIQKASSMMVDYINKYGMDDELGLFSTEVIMDLPDDKLVQKCRTLMNQLYDETKEILQENMTSLVNISEALLEYESLEDTDLDQLIA